MVVSPLVKGLGAGGSVIAAVVVAAIQLTPPKFDNDQQRNEYYCGNNTWGIRNESDGVAGVVIGTNGNKNNHSKSLDEYKFCMRSYGFTIGQSQTKSNTV